MTNSLWHVQVASLTAHPGQRSPSPRAQPRLQCRAAPTPSVCAPTTSRRARALGVLQSCCLMAGRSYIFFDFLLMLGITTRSRFLHITPSPEQYTWQEGETCNLLTKSPRILARIAASPTADPGLHSLRRRARRLLPRRAAAPTRSACVPTTSARARSAPLRR